MNQRGPTPEKGNENMATRKQDPDVTPDNELRAVSRGAADSTVKWECYAASLARELLRTRKALRRQMRRDDGHWCVYDDSADCYRPTECAAARKVLPEFVESP